MGGMQAVRSGSGPNPLMDPPAGPACVDLAMMVMVRKRIVTVVSELTDEERWNRGDALMMLYAVSFIFFEEPAWILDFRVLPDPASK